MTIAAAFSVVALVGVILWQSTSSWRESKVAETSNEVEISTLETADSGNRLDWQRAFNDVPVADEAKNTPVDVEDSDGLSNIGENVLGTLVGSYITLKDSGIYSQEVGNSVAEVIAEDLRANVTYRIYSASDVTTDPDPSVTRMLSYRSDMRVALEPLLKNRDYELEVFARYVDTNDASHLEELERMAQNYQIAIENTAKIVVPKQAVAYHLAALNALSEFEIVLMRMTQHADDPYAAAALLRAFGNAETNMFLSFDALAGYFRAHSRS